MMNLQIRVFQTHDIEAVIELSLLAWAPIFDSFRHIMGPSIFALAYPNWQTMQTEVVKTFCQTQANRTIWVAEVNAAEEAAVVGFLVCDLNEEEKKGEVQLLAVHPHYQNQGIGTALNDHALVKMKASGMKLAVVGTGGDPAHAPARRSYEKAGYIPLPSVWYFKDL